MKGVQLSCPWAVYTDGMKIRCTRGPGERTMCGFQYFKRCKGWWALTDAAGRCRLRQQPEGSGSGRNGGTT